MKQKELSRWIKAIAALGGLGVLFLGLVVAPKLSLDCAAAAPEFASLRWPCLIFVWSTTLPVLAVAVCAWLIGANIGRDRSFCVENASMLRFCCYMAVLDTVAYLAAGVLLACMSALHVSIALLILAICALGVACAVVFAALSHLTLKAHQMQSENDLTI